MYMYCIYLPISLCPLQECTVQNFRIHRSKQQKFLTPEKIVILKYFIQHCFIGLPSDSIVSEGAGIEPQDCCEFGFSPASHPSHLVYDDNEPRGADPHLVVPLERYHSNHVNQDCRAYKLLGIYLDDKLNFKLPH
jgi:hypothetical protein